MAAEREMEREAERRTEEIGRFAGFPGRGARYTALPDLFFSRLLGEIADPAELKALLYVFWRLRGKRGDAQFVTLSELVGIPTVLGAFGTTVESARDALRAALEAGMRRGTLIEVILSAEGANEHVYFLNTPLDAERARRVRDGDLSLRLLPRRVAQLPRRRRPYETAWEERIGLLTPAIARQLEGAVTRYGEPRVMAVIADAAERARRPWPYVRSRLERLAFEADGGEREEPA